MRYCTTLTRDQIRMLAQATQPGDTGFEIRLDSFETLPDVAALRAATGRPLLATFRSKPHLGLAEASARDEHGWAWRIRCVEAGFDLVDVELDEPDIDAKIAAIRLNGARSVVSHHALSGSDRLEEKLDMALATGADIVKIVGTGSSAKDWQRQRNFYARCRDRALIHFLMGREYAASRVLSMVYGAPFTFAAPEGSAGAAPGQLTVALLEKVFDPCALVGGEWYLFAVIGSPIGHSRSPLFHNPRLKARNPRSLFLPLPASQPRDLDALLVTFPELRGLAVTKPMKEAAFSRADTFLDPQAESLGAVNTLVRHKDRLHGANTDLSAMVDILRKQKPNGTVRVLGYGGLGKAVVAACRALSLEVEVCNRSPERLVRLPSGVRAIPWAERHREGPGTVVQATSAGMAPNESETPLDRLPGSVDLLVETIYNPEETALMRMARKKGLRTVGGGVLFQRQAEIQAGIFLDHLPAGKST